VALVVSDSFALSDLFGVTADLPAALFLRPGEFTPAFVDCLDGCAVPVLRPVGGFATDLLVTLVADRRVVPVFFPDDGLVADLLVTVADERRVVPVTFDCFSGVALEPDLLTVLLSEDLTPDLLF
jgi:hypothetical protein